MAFKTKFGEPISRCLHAYQSVALQVSAIEILIQTILEQRKTDEVDELAKKTCRGLHGDEPSGVVCARCFESASSGPLPVDPEDVAAAASGADPEFVRGLLAG